MLKGPITPGRLVEVLKLLAETGATGTLRVSTGGEQAAVGLWQGTVGGLAGGNPGADGPGDLIDEMAKLLEATDGVYHFHPEERPAPPAGGGIEVAAILAARGHAGEANLDLVLRPSAKVEGIVELTSDEWSLVVAAAEDRNLAQLAERVGLDQDRVARAVEGLIDRHLAEVVTPVAPAQELRVAVVCTGNQFRSPLVAERFRQLTSGLPVRVESYGTQDVGDAPALPEAKELGAELGLDLSGHTARSIETADLASADLVVVFERVHLARAVVDAGAPHHATFLLVELVRLLEATEPPLPTGSTIDRARQRVVAASRQRAPVSAPSSQEEIIDPLGGPARHFRRTAERLSELTEELVRELFGVRP